MTNYRENESEDERLVVLRCCLATILASLLLIASPALGDGADDGSICFLATQHPGTTAQMLSASFMKLEEGEFRSCMLNRTHLIEANLRTACSSSVAAGIETSAEAMNRIGLQWAEGCK